MKTLSEYDKYRVNGIDFIEKNLSKYRQNKQMKNVIMRKKISTFIAFLALFLILPLNTNAALNISILPHEGGNSLRFGRVTSGDRITKELKIRITSTSGRRYELRQRLLEPLRDERGVQLDREALRSNTLRGSNSFGSLYQDYPAVLNTLNSILYVSSTQGSSDSFYVVYTLDGSKINASGSFFARILYTLTPIGGSESEKEVILNIYFDAENKFDIDLSTSSSSSRNLKLSVDREEVKGFIKINIQGSLGQPYYIYQSLSEPFKNERGDTFPEKIFKFSVLNNRGQSNHTSNMPLNKRRLLLYSSEPTGQGDEIIITFFISEEDLDKLKNGHFRARLEYDLESSGAFTEKFPVDLDLEVRPVFDIEVISESSGGMRFQNLKPDSPAVKKEVLVKVKSNIDKPYFVVQKVATPLTSENGKTIPLELFTVKQHMPEGKSGQIFFSQDTPVKIGDSTVFSSDSEGSPSEFSLVYSLEAPVEVRAGDYFTSVNYSLIEK